MLIESGSLDAGADVAAWGLPEGTALRIERPASALRPLLSSYAVLDSEPALWDGNETRLLPATAQIWIGFTADPVRVRARGRRPQPLGTAMVIGPSSTAMPLVSYGGVSVVVEVRAAGWARFFPTAAEEVRDRIVPLASLWPADRAAALVARVGASGLGAGVKDALDGFLLDHLPPPDPAEEAAARVDRWLATEPAGGVTGLHAALGFGTARTLGAACRRSLGFGPKLLQRRRRCAHAFVGLLLAERPDHGAVPPGYHDVPHFHRDAREFLGMSARRYLALRMLYPKAVMRARRAIVGAPTAVLDGLPG